MEKNKVKRGRPQTKYNEEELYLIIKHYRQNVKPHGNIKYTHLYNYHLMLHKKNPDICRRIFSEDFWRKKGQPGRTAIDTANEIRKVTLVDGENKTKSIPNVVDLVENFNKDPERLIKLLKPMENDFKRSIEKENELRRKYDELKEILEREKIEKKRYLDQVSHLQECIFKMFHYSDKDGIPLENLLNINNKNKRIQMALSEAFSSPQNFLIEFNDYYSKSSHPDNNVVSIEKEKTKKSIADDFRGRF